jgi:hypothetical protein
MQRLCHVRRILKTLTFVGWAHISIFAQDSIQYRLLKGPGYQVFEDGVTQRARVRCNYYTPSSNDPWDKSPGQVSIEYGLPVWKAEYDTLFDKLPTGKRWRLGSNYWTNLSASFPFEIAGKQLKAGYYYLVMERTGDKLWSLVLLEPAEVARRQLDPYHVNLKDSGKGVRVPLQWEKVDQQADRLKITLKLRDENPKQMLIHIFFGRHHFTSPPLAVQF